MSKAVTIAVPIFKRLECLPGVLRSVEFQDHPDINLVVSDNGKNGAMIAEIVSRHYSRPYRLRQTVETVNIPTHYQEVLAEVKDEYFVWLADDDLLGSTFVSELVRILEAHPDVSVAVAKQDVIDSAGRVIRGSSKEAPDFLSGEEFIRNWTTYKFENFSTLMARTADIRACGGWGMFPRGTASDDALLIKLCLKGRVALSQRCTFQYRWHETSHGFSISLKQLADDLGYFLRFLDSDPIVCAYAKQQPAQWAELKRGLVTITWKTYWDRWKTLYRPRLSTVQWVRAAFHMPYSPAYYSAVFATLREAARDVVVAAVKQRIPWVYRFYRSTKTRV